MKHLFIINPAAKKTQGRTAGIKEEINAFFRQYPGIPYDIYISEWCRDAVTYVRSYVLESRLVSDETVRVHAIGGTGTLFEIINGIAGLSGAEAAAHSYGRANSFLQYFGMDKVKFFASMHSQVFDRSIPVDIIRCGNNYGICYGIAGIEAHANSQGDKWVRLGVPDDLSYTVAAVYKILKDKDVGQNYNIDIDGVRLFGDYISVMVANTPCYGGRMYPAVDAHPDDGMLDVYLFKNTPKTKILKSIPIYVYGNYRKLPGLVTHCRAKTVKLSSDKAMCMSIDGEYIYGTSIDYEILPGAVQFVCPESIDLNSLPRIYNKPKEGQRGER